MRGAWSRFISPRKNERPVPIVKKGPPGGRPFAVLAGSLVFLIFARSERRDADAGDAGLAHAQRVRRAPGNVDDAATNERPAIIDGHGGRTAVPEIGDDDPGAERQRPMRRRQGADMTATGGAPLARIVGRGAGPGLRLNRRGKE